LKIKALGNKNRQSAPVKASSISTVIYSTFYLNFLYNFLWIRIFSINHKLVRSKVRHKKCIQPAQVLEYSSSFQKDEPKVVKRLED